MRSTKDAASEALFLADNLALDFINTLYGTGQETHEVFKNDASVLTWLKTADQLPQPFDAVPQGLAERARELRECAEVAIKAAQSKVSADVSIINDVMEQGRPERKLEWDDRNKAFRVVYHRARQDADSLLAPVAESLTELMTGHQFMYVKQCEAHDCILLFLDLTKSHRRRWCNMATCGNRMKVAAFRARKKDA